MQDTNVFVAKIVVASLWTTATVLVVAAWALAVTESWDYALMVGVTASAVSVVAATAHIRRYAMRLFTLMRLRNEIDGRGSQPPA